MMRRIREWREVMGRPGKHLSPGVLTLGGFNLPGGFISALEAANTEGFCVPGHEVRDNVHQELQETRQVRGEAAHPGAPRVGPVVRQRLPGVSQLP